MDAELEERYDVVVVGGGAAGLGGALALARARRDVLVVDAGEPRNAPAGHVHNYLAREGVVPGDLLAAGRAEVTSYGGRIVTATVASVRRLEGSSGDPDGDFVVEFADGRVVRARRLLVTTGLVDDLPPVPGLALRWGRDVLHCPYCHGWEVRDQAIGVLATGPLAVHHALLWRQWSPDVILFLHTAGDPSDEQWEQLAARGVTVVDGEVTAVETEQDRLTGVRLADGRFVARQALVVTPRFSARAGLLADLGLRPTDEVVDGQVIGDRIVAEATGATSIPGVWVAGNVVDPRAQVLPAAAAGLNAAAAINADLVGEETRHAVAVHRARQAPAATGAEGAVPMTPPGRA